MTAHQTVKDTQQQFVGAMGPDLGTLFWGLWNECAWLHRKWGEYLVLFGTEPERVELLNAAAPSFFRLVQHSLGHDVLLRICRLTDPPKSAGKENLTLRRLPALVAPQIRRCSEVLVDKALCACQFARDWRNRRIAHRDLALALEEGATPLAPARRQDVDGALDSIVALLDAIQLYYQEATTAYRMGPAVGGAEALLDVLRDGLEADEQRRKRLSGGKPLPEDLKPRPPV